MGGSREPSSAAVVGMLFGKGDDVGVTIVDATDAVYNSDGPGSTSFNMVEMAKKIQLWTTMDENRATKMLGWYSFGLVATAEHLKIHSKVKYFNGIFIGTRKCDCAVGSPDDRVWRGPTISAHGSEP